MKCLRMSRNSNNDVTLWYGDKKRLECLAVINDQDKTYFPDIDNNGDIERVQFVPHVDMIAYANEYSNLVYEKLAKQIDKDNTYTIDCKDVSDIVFTAILDTLEGLKLPDEQALNVITKKVNYVDSEPNTSKDENVIVIGPKYINAVDDVWHDSACDLVPFTTDVEFMDKQGNIYKGEIVVEMSGHYVYIRESNHEGWDSFDNMVKWRFIPGKTYYSYGVTNHTKS